MSENNKRLLTDVRIEELPPYRVAYYRAVGKQPETKAWRVLYDWAKRKGLMDEGSTSRRFGFNNPNPKPGEPEYGYEVWITVDDDVTESEEIRIKEFKGGQFAVMQTDLAHIGEQWRTLVKWVKASKYNCGSGQCLEEVMSSPDTVEDELVFELYLPVVE